MYANVFLKGSDFGTYTDSVGFFELIGVPYGKYEIVVTAIGYEDGIAYESISEKSPSVFVELELKSSAETLDEIVVSGTMRPVRTTDSPVQVESYSARFFRSNPTPSVFESLQNVNGVRPQINCNICNTGDIHTNGLEGPYTMILIDGMPIVSGLSTVYGLTGIPQALIDRIEIVKGPASTLYGSEAVGGLINVITKDPYSASALSVDMFATTWEEVNVDIGIKSQIGDAHSLLGINYFNYSKPVDHNLDGFTDVTLQHRISAFNKWTFSRAFQRSFSLAARYVYEDRWGGELGWTSRNRGEDDIYAESIYTSRWETFGNYQLPLHEFINFQFSANGHHQNSAYGTTIYNADQYVGFAQLSWQKDLFKMHHLLLGAAYRYTFYDDNTFATAERLLGKNKPSVTHLPGIFAQDEWSIGAHHKLLLGLRFDQNNIHGDIWSPRINYKWTSTDEGVILRVGAGNGFRVANVFTEDHAALTGARDVVFIDELLPERSWNGNVTISRQIYTATGDYYSIDGSVFYTYFENRIVPDYESDQNKIIYGNLEGHAISKGVSLNVNFNLRNGFQGSIGSTLMDVLIVENEISERQLLTEQFAGVWRFSYMLPKSKILLDYTGNIYSPMRLPLLGDKDDRPANSPWYSIQNIQISKPWNNLEVYMGIKNLLNFTPPPNSIARSFDPFDKDVQFGLDGQVLATADNPNALTFDPSYVFAPNQGLRVFLGFRYSIL